MSTWTQARRWRRAVLLGSTAALCGGVWFALAADAAAQAQTQSQSDDQAAGQTEEIEEIIVTGTRIRRPELQATSPVTVLNSDEVAFRGTTRIEDLINTLPQAFAGQGAFLANGASGTATVDLRGLGASRTLVLINGRRLMPGTTGGGSAADLNFVPPALIKRVDVLTGGASAVYGSDAVAGVVNFILDTDFTGVRVDAQYNFFQHNNDNKLFQQLNADRGFEAPKGSVTDGQGVDITIAMGSDFAEGKGHAMAYARYFHVEDVAQDKRDFSNCALNATNSEPFYRCAGSFTNAPANFLVFSPDFADEFDLTIDRTTGNTLRDLTGGDVFNFAPFNFFQRPDEKFMLGGFVNYDINDHFKPYLEVMFMDDRTLAQIAPSGDFAVTDTLRCDNPLFSADEVEKFCTQFGLSGDDTTNVIILRRNVEGGPRQDDLRHTDFRIVTGINGDIDSDGIFTYDLYGLYSSVQLSEVFLNDLSITRLKRAVDVVTDPDTGQPVCRSVLDGSDPNCVPWNIFQLGPNGESLVDPAAVAYLSVPGFSDGESIERIVSGSVSGDLGQYGVQSPLASDGVGFAAGFEYRKESANFRSDLEEQTGDLAGFGGAVLPIKGSFQVWELFAELHVPVIQDRPFVKELNLDLGYRYSNYNTRANVTNTYKLAGEWAPVDDLRFRGGYNRAVRAPNISELFSPQQVALDGEEDPCAGPKDANGLVNGHTFEQCARTGVTPDQFGSILPNPASQYNGFIGGNPDLQPEKADTYTVGVVLTPRDYIPGFVATIDYFDIQLKNQIAGIGADTIILTCVNSDDPVVINNLCPLVHRDPNTGSLWLNPNGFIIDTLLNTGNLHTRGVDFTADYTYDLGEYGDVRAHLVGTELLRLNVNNSAFGAEPFDCAGLYAHQCGLPNPHWRHNLRVTWDTPWSGANISIQWRYFGSVKSTRVSNQPVLQGTEFPAAKKIGSENYIDLVVGVNLLDHVNLEVGVNNLFDNTPPVPGSNLAGPPAGNGNIFPQVYDPLGRFIFFHATVDF